MILEAGTAKSKYNFSSNVLPVTPSSPDPKIRSEQAQTVSFIQQSPGKMQKQCLKN